MRLPVLILSAFFLGASAGEALAPASPPSIPPHLQAALAARPPMVPPVPYVAPKLTPPAKLAPVQLPSDQLAAEIPAVDAFARCMVFEMPLHPLGNAPASQTEDRDLAVALRKVHAQGPNSGLQSIEEFLAAHPQSRWSIGLKLNLGILWMRSGFRERARSAWSEVWNATKDAPAEPARGYADRAVAELAAQLAWAGRMEELAPLLASTATRTPRGLAAFKLEHAARKLNKMQTAPEVELTCGPYAVASLIEPNPASATRRQAINAVKSVMRAQGSYAPKAQQTRSANRPALAHDLTEVREIARGMGFDYQAVRAVPGTRLPTPCIVHWKLGHYAVLIESTQDGYRLADISGDPTERVPGSISQAALEDSASGVYLVPNGPLAKGLTALSDQEARQFWGRGGDDAEADDGGNTPCDSATGDCQTSPAGPPSPEMPTYRFHLQQCSLNIIDSPFWHNTVRGPGLAFTLRYVERDTGAAVWGNPNGNGIGVSNLGPQWTCDWFSGLVVSGNQITYYPPGGGFVKFPVAGGRQMLIPGALSVTGTSAQMQFDDGTKYQFTQFPNTSSYGISAIIDQEGNQLSFSYDSQNRLQFVRDAVNATARLTYDGSNRIVSVYLEGAAPARAASMQYDSSGRLVSITDMGGLASSFSYETRSAYLNTAITAMTTPYGTTTFARNIPNLNVAFNGKRWIQATDPQGDSQRVEYRTDVDPATGAPNAVFGPGAGSEPVTTVPVSATSGYQNYNLNYRNVFYWSKKQFKESNNITDANGNVIYPNFSPDTAATIPQLQQATCFHFLHKFEGSIIRVSRTLESVRAPNANRVFYRYLGQTSGDNEAGIALASPSQVLVRLADGTDQITSTSFTANYQVATTTDPLQRTLTFSYEANGIDLHDVRAGVGQFLGGTTWDSKHHPTSIVDAAGNSTSLTYVSSVPDPITQVIHPAAGKIESITPPIRSGQPAETTHFLYYTEGSQAGRLSQVWNFAGRTSYSYDDFGRVASVSVEAGRNMSVAFTYDALDRVTTATYSDGTYEQVVWNRQDPEWTRDRMGRWSHTVFNAIRQVVATQDAAGQTTLFDWCRCGALQKMVDPLGRVTRWDYDLMGRMMSKSYPDGRQVLYEYEAAWAPNGPAINGGNSRLRRVGDAKGQYVRYVYNQDDTIQQMIYENGAGVASTTTPGVSFTYDTVLPRIQTRVDGSYVNTTTFDYYPLLYPAAGAFPTPSADGSRPGALRSQTQTLGAGSTVQVALSQLRYDEWGRLVNSQLGNAASSTVTYGPYSSGRVTGISNALGAFSYQYEDGLQSGGSPRLAKIVMPNGVTTSLGWDTTQDPTRLQTITHALANGSLISQHRYGYRADGMITDWTTENGPGQAGDGNNLVTTRHFEYDAIDQLVSATSVAAAQYLPTIRINQAWRYDGAGNRVGSQFQYIPGASAPVVGTATFNALNQQTAAIPSGTLHVEGTIDRPAAVTVNGSPVPTQSGNRFSAEVPAATQPGRGDLVSNFTVSAQAGGQTTTNNYSVLSVPGTARGFSYDVNGNCLTDGNNGYTWDAADRLIRITRLSDGAASEFAYDSLGRRIRIVETSSTGIKTTRRFVWLGSRIAEERTDAGDVVKRFFGHGFTIETGALKGKYYYTRDHLGSIREIVDATGAVRARFDYDAWGNPSGFDTSIPVEFQDFGYTGHFWHQPSGLWLTWFRAYDPTTGRWLSRDPIGEAGGLNLYAYTGNNPINFIDKSGLENEAWHHLVPKAEEFKPFLPPNYDVHSPSNGWMMKCSDHDAIGSANWNKDWRDFFNGQAKTEEQINAFKETMKAKYGLAGKGKQAIQSYTTWSSKAARAARAAARGGKRLSKAIPFLGAGVALGSAACADTPGEAAYEAAGAIPVVGTVQAVGETGWLIIDTLFRPTGEMGNSYPGGNPDDMFPAPNEVIWPRPE